MDRVRDEALVPQRPPWLTDLLLGLLETGARTDWPALACPVIPYHPPATPPPPPLPSSPPPPPPLACPPETASVLACERHPPTPLHPWALKPPHGPRGPHCTAPSLPHQIMSQTRRPLVARHSRNKQLNFAPAIDLRISFPLHPVYTPRANPQASAQQAISPICHEHVDRHGYMCNMHVLRPDDPLLLSPILVVPSAPLLPSFVSATVSVSILTLPPLSLCLLLLLSRLVPVIGCFPGANPSDNGSGERCSSIVLLSFAHLVARKPTYQCPSNGCNELILCIAMCQLRPRLRPRPRAHLS